MECDCKVDSACTAASSYCQDGITDYVKIITDLWLDLGSVLTAAATVVGYLLYTFSQAFPALIGWPIRLICSLSGLPALWGWVSRLAGTFRVIQSFFKWLSRTWWFIVALFSKLSWVPITLKTIAGFVVHAKECLESFITLKKHIRRPSRDTAPDTPQMGGKNIGQSPVARSSFLTRSPKLFSPSRPKKPDLRLILLGPSGGGRTSLANTLLGGRETQTQVSPGPLMESTMRRMVVEDREVTLIDTPDLLGSSLGDSDRALEALRSLQLANPGPHAFLLVIRAPGSGEGTDEDATRAIQAVLELFGDSVAPHILIVLTHADCLGVRRTLAQLLEVDTGGLRTGLSLCGLRAELVDNGLHCPPEARRATRRRLVERVVEMRALRGHFIHELQRREDRIRVELLADMASVLARKLGHM
ncbi:GTPase IMAP family member 4-like [Polymixia lowei]